MGQDGRAFAAPELDYDLLFQAYQSTLAAYCERASEGFPSAEVRLAIVSSMMAEAGRGELDAGRLSAFALASVTDPFSIVHG